MQDGSLRCWDLASGELLHERAEVRASAFTSLTLVGAEDDSVSLAASSYNAGIFSYKVGKGCVLSALAHTAADPAAAQRDDGER